MKNVTKLPAIPEDSAITHGFGEIHYHDTYRVRKRTDKSIEDISKEMMRSPDWATALLKLRNAAVGVFGLKAGKPDVLFSLISKSENEMVMGVPDKHLDFRVSIIKDPAADAVYLTTVVHFNNAWRRVYFFPVKPFHKLIVNALLKRYGTD